MVTVQGPSSLKSTELVPVLFEASGTPSGPAESRPLVAVVIVNWNQWCETLACMDSVLCSAISKPSSRPDPRGEDQALRSTALRVSIER